MPQNRRIYLLDPKKLGPETIAVTFAKTSRSPLPFDAIAEELSDDTSADFHEKWVVGYGHSSVAEHAVLHIAVENVSRLAIECLESNRLASYTEKSSRYQVWDEDHFYIPDEFKHGGQLNRYIDTCSRLFDAYQRAFSIISRYLGENLAQGEFESDRAFSSRARSASADVCRYFLPACSQANVGISINARALEHAITKMLSHPLSEVHAIGQEIKLEALNHVPTLVKYADRNAYLTALNEIVFNPQVLPTGSEKEADEWCDCIDFDCDGEEKILAALIYRFGMFTMHQAMEEVRSLNETERKQLAKQLFKGSGNHDQPPREFEYGSVIFDLVLDQGAYFELKRHRMMTQTVQRFTPFNGYAIPKLIAQTGLMTLFKEMMELARMTYEDLAAGNAEAASYVLPNAYNRRVLMQMNLRSAIHLIKLRCAENAHFAIRRPTLRIAEILMEKYPLFAEILTPCTSETWKSVEEDFFVETHTH